MRRRGLRVLISIVCMVVVLCSSALIATTALAQTASISGTVLLDEGDKPIANAEVVLSDVNRSTRSDTKGRFEFTGLLGGKHHLVVRMIGFDPFAADVTIGSTEKFDAEFLLHPLATQLNQVNVRAKESVSDWRMKQFETRRRASPGSFLGSELFRNSYARTITSIVMSRVAGISTSCSMSTCYVKSTRAGCMSQIVLNGMTMYNSRMGIPFDINTLVTTDVLGVEYYSSLTTPVEYFQDRCGTIVLWTRNG